MRKNIGYDAERYEVLAAVNAKAGTEVSQESVGAYRTKLVRAGEYLYVQCYPLISREARERQEEALQTLKKSTDRKVNLKYARYNNARRVYEFNQLVEANFGYNDLHIAATYPAPQYGMEDRSGEAWRSREDALKDRRNYIRRVQRLLKRHGCDLNEFRWIAVTVSKEPDMEARKPFSPTHHHHILMHGVPEELRGEVERLWRFGYCNADRCQPDSKGLADLAGYVARQEGRANGDHKAGEKSYSASRNIKRPEVRTADKKISKRRVAQLAADVRANAPEVFGKIWPGYRLVEEPVIYISDFVAGAYIRAKLRVKETERRWERRRR